MREVGLKRITVVLEMLEGMNRSRPGIWVVQGPLRLHRCRSTLKSSSSPEVRREDLPRSERCLAREEPYPRVVHEVRFFSASWTTGPN
jgi:hypothetical protein